jgi:NitT/TauT family transport system ATP-binding protein
VTGDEATREQRAAATPINTSLPDVSVGGLAGLLEVLVGLGGQEGLGELVDELNFEIDDLLPSVDAGVLLGLAHTREVQLEITEEGLEFTAADILSSKQFFARHAARRPADPRDPPGLRHDGKPHRP